MASLTHTTLQRASGQQAGVYVFANGVLVFSPLSQEKALALVQREVKSGFKHLAEHTAGLLPNTKIQPKEDYIEPVLQANGCWSYGFQDLEVGHQMRCPLNEGETHTKAQVRCYSCAVNWAKRHVHHPERAHIRFTSASYGTYILIERIA
jgi:hypothetical protein